MKTQKEIKTFILILQGMIDNARSETSRLLLKGKMQDSVEELRALKLKALDKRLGSPKMLLLREARGILDTFPNVDFGCGSKEESLKHLNGKYWKSTAECIISNYKLLS